MRDEVKPEYLLKVYFDGRVGKRKFESQKTLPETNDTIEEGVLRVTRKLRWIN